MCLHPSAGHRSEHKQLIHHFLFFVVVRNWHRAKTNNHLLLHVYVCSVCAML